MKSRFPFVLLLLLPLCGHAATLIGPDEFEQIWLLNNQRNLVARYHQRTEQFRSDPRSLWRLDLDATANQQIRTTAGDMEAIMDRIGIHYQGRNYLFLVDWLSLIPQPQTTEGFTYGDLVLGRSWQRGDRLSFTLGGRMQTRPKATQSGGQSVFNLTDNASSDSIGGFVHINYDAWDFGSYYSGRDGNQANSLGFTLIDSDTRRLAGAITQLGGAPDRNIPARNELSLNLREQLALHELRAGLTAAAHSGIKAARLSNASLDYLSPGIHGFRFSIGLYHTYLIDTGETLPGGKLGIEYTLDINGDPLTMGAFVRQNSFGDINAMVVRDEPVFSFVMSARAQF